MFEAVQGVRMHVLVGDVFMAVPTMPVAQWHDC
jgi:hypothetical protein